MLRLRALACSLGLGLLAGLGGCGPDPAEVEWRLEMAPGIPGDAGAAVHAEIRRGGCGEDGEVVYGEARRREAGAMRGTPPELAPGRYAFAASLVDAACAPIAAGCAEVELPRTSRVVTVLAPSAGAARCDRAACDRGVCTAPDGGARDAGAGGGDAGDGGACAVDDDCGAAACGAWSDCTASGCSTSGTQSRQCMRPRCLGGACFDVPDTETQPCARVVEGAECAPAECGAWSGCSYAYECSEGAPDEQRTCTTATCRGGVCAYRSVTESRACTRSTAGDPCAGGGHICDSGCCIGPVQVVPAYACDVGPCATDPCNGFQAWCSPEVGWHWYCF